ncbi:SseB family protein [Salinibacterium hongtaonis]|uniref:SseB family protein n=1 Tax=Homoserinimonas hongtaonis TaxID=2079791 RepID=A0A2U1SXG2_9MICO|nr:SseB family protein [Salinibacterium hongtaonis]AWB88921.1 hypothetical protein C2138_04600 [Salinibacterium hongtaonis]PWB96320.1 SseB family protein [Salinibacterium hongtaonis]
MSAHGDHEHHSEPSHLTDSAGQPWAGRSFGETPFSDDDGSADPGLLDAIAQFRSGEATPEEVVDALRSVRLLVPLMATLGEAGENASGVTVDKSADLAIVTVAGPDGRSVMPVFSSVAAMQAWNPRARPVPTESVRVALAAADEGTDLVVLDPTSDSEFVVRRPAVWAIAQSLPWVACWRDPEVSAVVERICGAEGDVVSVELMPGDPDARLRGPELIVVLGLRAGLEPQALRELVARIQAGLSTSEVVATRVDSLTVRLAPAS